jgi:hypothetical protein
MSRDHEPSLGILALERPGGVDGMGNRSAQPAGPGEDAGDLGDGARHVIDVVQAHVRHGKIKRPRARLRFACLMSAPLRIASSKSSGRVSAALSRRPIAVRAACRDELTVLVPLGFDRAMATAHGSAHIRTRMALPLRSGGLWPSRGRCAPGHRSHRCLRLGFRSRVEQWPRCSGMSPALALSAPKFAAERLPCPGWLRESSNCLRDNLKFRAA